MSDIDELDSYLHDDEEDFGLPTLQELDGLKESTIITKDDTKANTGNSTVNENTDSIHKDTDEMVNSLEQEFNKVFIKNQSHSQRNNDNNNGENDASNEFHDLLKMISDASKAATNSDGGKTKSNIPKGETNNTDFKDIMSNTLGRLKENSNKIDSDLKNEQSKSSSSHNNNNSNMGKSDTDNSRLKSNDDILSQLLDQLVNDSEGETNADGNDGTQGNMMDNAILKMLDQMCTKEVLYSSMKDMQINFTEWFKQNSEETYTKEVWDRYVEQNKIINKIVTIYELPAYTNEKNVSEITDLLDHLEELGDTPEEVATNKSSTLGTNSSGMPFSSGSNSNNADMSGLDLDEKSLENLDQELQENCKQQ